MISDKSGESNREERESYELVLSDTRGLRYYLVSVGQ